MMKKYKDFLLEDVTQAKPKVRKGVPSSSVDAPNTEVKPENTEIEKPVDDSEKEQSVDTKPVETETTTEGGEKPVETETTTEGGEKPVETEKIDISPDSKKVSKNINNFYNRLGLSLKDIDEMKSRNPNDVQQKNNELKPSVEKEQTQQPTQQTQQPTQQTQQPTQQPEQDKQEPSVEKDMTNRQLGFKKDSTEQLKAKLNNPAYAKYKNEINSVLSSREKQQTAKPKVNVKQQPNTGNV